MHLLFFFFNFQSLNFALTPFTLLPVSQIHETMAEDQKGTTVNSEVETEVRVSKWSSVLQKVETDGEVQACEITEESPLHLSYDDMSVYTSVFCYLWL